MSKKAVDTLIIQIRAMAAVQPDPAGFLKDLQSEIQLLPGAEVAFATRDLKWLESYMEERGEVSPERQQAAMVSVSADYEENYASQDGITYAMNGYLDARFPKQDEEFEP
ncbi:hypothetical protein KUV57_11240 [Epibacterium sp. DP7N7-1]|nr:hypothetical protein [Epibacterium sp. DP7N7-1]